MPSAFLDNVLDSLFLAERFVAANEFDPEARFASQAFCIAACIIVYFRLSFPMERPKS